MHEKVASEARLIAELTADLARSRLNARITPAMTEAAIAANHFVTNNAAMLSAAAHTPEAFALSVGKQVVGKPTLAAVGPWFKGLLKIAVMQGLGEAASGAATGGLVGAGLGLASTIQGGGKLFRRTGLGALAGGLIGAGIARKSNPTPGTYKTPQQLGYGSAE